MNNKLPIFTVRCIDWDAVLATPNLSNMMKIVKEQSKTEEAKKRVNLATYKDYNEGEECPPYFGMFGEFLCYHFLNHYGHLWNIEGVTMTDSTNSAIEDYGTDGVGYSAIDGKYKGRRVKKGTPVYLQVKATTNSTKEYQPNDGSRLPNFGMNAMSTAIVTGKAYQGRYVVFTTGRGLHWTLDKMSNGLLEVINYEKIKPLVNGSVTFLNRMRVAVGLDELPIEAAEADPEWILMQEEDCVA